MEPIQVLQKIHDEIYLRDVDYSSNKFLCGSSPDQKSSLRQLIYDRIKSDPKYNVVFPEFLFSSKNYQGNFNLLKLENLLADNVDIIILPLEAIGTYCELGAFAVTDNLRKKIIVINEKKYKNQKSFITVGPIELIEKDNKRNVFWYDNNAFNETLDKLVERLKFWRKALPHNKLDNIFNLSRYILYVIALYQPITLKQLRDLVKIFLPPEADLSFVDSALQILIKKDRITFDVDQKSMHDFYCLSKEGHIYVFEELLKKLSAIKDFTKIRNELLSDKMKKTKFNWVRRNNELEL